MSEPRRWTLVEGQGGYEHGYSESEGSLGPGESIEVVEATRESELEDRCMDLHLETERLISERDRETDLRREAEAEVERLRGLLWEAFKEGFYSSAEGYNGEMNSRASRETFDNWLTPPAESDGADV